MGPSICGSAVSVLTRAPVGAVTTARDTAAVSRLPSALSIEASNSTLVYTAAPDSLDGFPAGLSATVAANDVSTVLASDTAFAHAADATISIGGIRLAVHGELVDGDIFTVAGNASGDGENRDALLLDALHAKSSREGGTTNCQGGYSQW